MMSAAGGLSNDPEHKLVGYDIVTRLSEGAPSTSPAFRERLDQALVNKGIALGQLNRNEEAINAYDRIGEIGGVEGKATSKSMDVNRAILYAKLIRTAYAAPPNEVANFAGKTIKGGDSTYEVVTSIYANDLCTDMNPVRGDSRVSIGLVLQASSSGDVVIAIRGTEAIYEWIHDAQFLLSGDDILAPRHNP